MTRSLRGGLVTLFAGLAIGLTAGPVGAGTLTRTGNDYAFTADAGEADVVSINPGGTGRFLLGDTADTITLGTGTTGCTGGGTTSVDCPVAQTLAADLGDLGDSVSISDLVSMSFSLDGGDGIDSLDGGMLDDNLLGGSGNDVLFSGDAGSDLIMPGPGTDTNISGGIGSDIISYLDGRLTSVSVNLGVAPATGADGETFASIEEVIGTNFDDTLVATGAGFRTELSGFDGNDTLAGGIQGDSLLGGDGDDTIGGNQGNDILRGSDGADLFAGGDGDDFLTGGLGADNLAGGNGSDTASYVDRDSSVEASLVGGTQDGDTYTSIENLEGGNGPDTLQGDANANVLIGNEGQDTLIGGSGADTLKGGRAGGESDGVPDTASYEERATPVVATLLLAHQDGDIYTDIQNLIGGGGNDTLSGDGGPNTLDGGNGNDELIGGFGADTLIGGGGFNTTSYQDGRSTGISLDLRAAAGPDGDTYSQISRFVGTNFADEMIGGSGDVDFAAADGDDVVRTRFGGEDTVDCGDGEDAHEAGAFSDASINCELLQRGEAGMAIADLTFTEGHAGQSVASLTVSLDQATVDGASASFATTDGSATAPSDYAATSGTVTFARGQTTATIDVVVKGETVVEPDETFGVALSSVDGVDGLDTEATATIANDDIDAPPAPPPPGSSALPTLTISNAKVKEGNRGTKAMTFLVQLSAPSATPVTVGFKTQKGTAKPRSDFAGRSGLLTFAPGQTLMKLVVKIKGDLRDERDEKFKVLLANVAGATLLDAEGVGTIRDND